jgi:hypothetical protein
MTPKKSVDLRLSPRERQHLQGRPQKLDVPPRDDPILLRCPAPSGVWHTAHRRVPVPLPAMSRETVRKQNIAKGMSCGARVMPRARNVFRRRCTSAISAGDRDTILAMTAIVTWLSVHKRTTSPSRICTHFANSSRDSRAVDSSKREM